MKVLYLDAETTGLDPANDRAVEVSMILVDDESGAELATFDSLVHPERKIPQEVIEIHGIRDEDVAESPKFPEIKDQLLELFDQCEAIAGFNVSFDLKLLRNEFMRCGAFLDIYQKRIWDMQKIFFHHEPRNLGAAMRFYCNREIEGAHRAINDVRATIDVFKAQKERYELDMQKDEVKAYAELDLPLDSNHAFCFDAKGNVTFTFGKFKGKIANNHDKEVMNYLSWMIGANFPRDTKNIARALCRGNLITRDNISKVAKGG